MCRARMVLLGGLALLSAGLPAQAALSVQRLTEPALYRVQEFEVTGVPAAANPFDPDIVRLEAVFSLPSGNRRQVPGFWHQPYTSRQQDGNEVLSKHGEAGWRVRFTPVEAGRHVVTVEAWLGRTAAGSAQIEFVVPESTGDAPAGFARVAPNQRYFETDHGEPLPLVGHCVCWHHRRGTADYEDWFDGMAAAGENYTRLWMVPWALGIETEPGSGTNYRLDRAWQLDRVFELAAERGIWLMLCFDYHGMFETEKDFWGGNDNWKINPYNTANGGPCAEQKEFFSLPVAREMYRKRLRYLIARYGAYPNLFAWQFFNEIDNVYSHLNAPEVARWHQEMGVWLKANDPWRHMVTTSLTGGSERPEIWALPAMDFSMYHSYGQGRPAEALPEIVSRFLTRYNKPMMVGEFGTDWRGWNREQDPHLRGWRQGIWAPALSGAVGNAMSWWWESIHAEDLYGTFGALKRFLDGTGFARGNWTPIPFPAAPPPPSEVGNLILGGEPFDVTLPLDPGWGNTVSGKLAVTNPDSGGEAAAHLNAFVHGASHADLRMPFQLSAWLGEESRLVLHLNSVSSGAVLSVLVDGQEALRRDLADKDGLHEVNGEYDEDIVVTLPAGRHIVEVRNAGADWFHLDWVRLEGVLPAGYANGWAPQPVVCGLKGPGELLLYIVNPPANYPGNATTETIPPLSGARLAVPDVPPGRYQVRWVLPATGEVLHENGAEATDAGMTLELPAFSEDLAVQLLARDQLSLAEPELSGDGEFAFQLRGKPAGVYAVEASPNLREWTVAATVEHGSADSPVLESATAEQRFYRARREN